ncbi:hypothetical protein BZA77DRAFT_359567 [Pyronema omphalodes]|nr:hypothetical protein BZA77DRAFT_359567 [Pyronema omphalodes]
MVNKTIPPNLTIILPSFSTILNPGVHASDWGEVDEDGESEYERKEGKEGKEEKDSKPEKQWYKTRKATAVGNTYSTNPSPLIETDLSPVSANPQNPTNFYITQNPQDSPDRYSLDNPGTFLDISTDTPSDTPTDSTATLPATTATTTIQETIKNYPFSPTGLAIKMFSFPKKRKLRKEQKRFLIAAFPRPPGGGGVRMEKDGGKDGDRDGDGDRGENIARNASNAINTITNTEKSKNPTKTAPTTSAIKTGDGTREEEISKDQENKIKKRERRKGIFLVYQQEISVSGVYVAPGMMLNQWKYKDLREGREGREGLGQKYQEHREHQEDEMQDVNKPQIITRRATFRNTAMNTSHQQPQKQQQQNQRQKQRPRAISTSYSLFPKQMGRDQGFRNSVSVSVAQVKRSESFGKRAGVWGFL